MKAGKVVLEIILLLLVTTTFAQKNTKNQQEIQLLTDNVFHLSEVMLHDVAAPVTASRFYAYALLGAYEAAYFSKGKLPNINEKFNVTPDIKPPIVPKNFNLSFTSSYAMLEVGRNIMPSGAMLVENQKNLLVFFKKKKKISDADLTDNVRYAQEIAKYVVAYARTDGYNKLSTFHRYTPNKKKEGHWYPTPPEYMAAIEPQWKTVRPFFLDSAAQFAPPPPVPFSKDSTSEFYKLMLEVYNIKNKLTKEQGDIANFWDCNPFAVDYSGHMAIGLKKISPGGHWMGIAGIATKKADISLDSAILVQTVVAVTLHDAFISCWQEKYFSDRIRPESAINILYDPSWRPLLQTPPFPEYTSGHSVASSSVAVVLTYLLGDNFSFVDTSEIYFGLPVREFKSFLQAANEAAVSRLYGGIHFRDACDNGVAQGKQVGQFVLASLFDVQAKPE
jgi:hypothetical protein